MSDRTRQLSSRPGSRSRLADRPLVHFGRWLLVFIFFFNSLFPQFAGINLPVISQPLQSASAASTTILISQFQVAGGTSADEFVELHNISSADYDLNGHRLVYRSATGTTDVSLVSWTSSKIIPPGGFLLAVATPGYDGSVAGDATFSGGANGSLSGTSGGLALRNGALNTGAIVDSVGYGTATNAFVEATTISVPASNSSRARKIGGCLDADNNSTDFDVVSPSAPRNSSSPATICSPFVDFAVLPSKFTFSASENGSSPASQLLTVTSQPGNSTFSYSAVPNVSWLSVSPGSGNGLSESTETLTVNPGTLTTGTYNGIVTVRNTSSFSDFIDVPVTLTIIAGQPQLDVSPDSLSFSTSVGSPDPASQSISVTTNSGTIPFTATASTFSGDPWLSLNPGSGTAPQAITATVTRGSLSTGTYTGTINITNTNNTANSRSVPVTFTISAGPVITPIYTIQGAALTSPYVSKVVTTEGVVTALKPFSGRGFYLQDPDGDGDVNTSDGIFVFTSSAPPAFVTVGRRLRVSGTVVEFKGSGRTNDQPVTEITGPTITDLGDYTGPAIVPVILTNDPARTGPNIRKIPSVIDSSPAYNPASDALDFYESLEGMLVQIDGARVVGPTNNFGEIVFLPDNGAGATGLTARGGIAISPGDFNPERVMIDDSVVGFSNIPKLVVGDVIIPSLVGPLDYNFGNYKIQILNILGAGDINTTNRVSPEQISPLANPNHLRIVSYNIENFSKYDSSTSSAELTPDPAHVITIATHIRQNLASPDLLLLSEVQDNNGKLNDAVVDADESLNALRDQIYIDSGNTISYSYRYINPVDDQDGGQPGGNIRQAFFYRTDRGLSFIDKPGGGSTVSNTVLSGGLLQYSPGRIAPLNAAFNTSRKPLAGEFEFKGQRLIVIANHLNSKGGDTPLYGQPQPPVLGSETQRVNQATIIRDFVTQILDQNPNANIIVGGDLNDFQFSPPLKILKNNNGALTGNQVLTALTEDPRLAGENYSYIFEGNGQYLDHILYSQGMGSKLLTPDVVHINSEFYNGFSGRGSDHDVISGVYDFSPAPQPNLVIKKSHSGSFLAGAKGTYTLTVTNTGTIATSGTFTVTDTLPFAGGSGLTFSSASSGCAAVGQEVSCTQASSLAIGASTVFTLEVNVNTNGGATGSITNTASVVGGGDTTPASDDDVTLIVAPDLALSKTGVGTFTAGGTGVYSLTVTNNGSGATTGAIVLTDTLPVGLTYGGSLGGAGWTLDSQNGQAITFTNNTSLSVGASSVLTFSVNISATASGTVTNRAGVTVAWETSAFNNVAQTDSVISPPCDPYKVTEPSDNGAGNCGTLSYALNQAALPGAAPVTITFASGLVTVTLTGPLPSVPVSTTVLGRLDTSGGRNVPSVKLVAGATASSVGLTLTTATVISGVAVLGFGQAGLEINGSNNLVKNSQFGKALPGDPPGNTDGVRVLSGSGNVLDGNLISGNSGVGVVALGGSTQLLNNWIGYARDNTRLRNGTKAVQIQGGQLRFGPGNRINQAS